jgi:hypothetical protein
VRILTNDAALQVRLPRKAGYAVMMRRPASSKRSATCLREVSRWHSRLQLGIATWFIRGLTVGGAGNTHRRLVHQQDRQNQINGIYSSGHMDGGNPAWPSGAMDCSVFPGMSRGRTQQLRSMRHHQFPLGGEPQRSDLWQPAQRCCKSTMAGHSRKEK